MLLPPSTSTVFLCFPVSDTLLHLSLTWWRWWRQVEREEVESISGGAPGINREIEPAGERSGAHLRWHSSKNPADAAEHPTLPPPPWSPPPPPWHGPLRPLLAVTLGRAPLTGGHQIKSVLPASSPPGMANQCSQNSWVWEGEESVRWGSQKGRGASVFGDGRGWWRWRCSRPLPRRRRAYLARVAALGFGGTKDARQEEGRRKQKKYGRKKRQQRDGLVFPVFDMCVGWREKRKRKIKNRLGRIERGVRLKRTKPNKTSERCTYWETLGVEIEKIWYREY